MKVISLINMKGGVGKSTLAVNIAHYLATKEQAKTLVIDIDPQFNSTQCLMTPQDYINHKKNKKDTIINIFESSRIQVQTVEGNVDVQPKKLSDIELVELDKNLFLLPGDLLLHTIEIVAGKAMELRLQKFLTKLDEMDPEDRFEYVIIDTPPTPSIWMTSALIASNYYLIPVKPEPLSLTGIDLLDGIIKEREEDYNLKLICLGVVLNMVEEAHTVFKETKSFLLKSPKWKNLLIPTFIPKRTDIAKRQTQGEFILDLNNSDLNIKLARLVGTLTSKMSQNP